MISRYKFKLKAPHNSALPTVFFDNTNIHRWFTHLAVVHLNPDQQSIKSHDVEAGENMAENNLKIAA